MHKRESDSDWIIKLLGIFKPDDEIFKKSYKYIRPRPVPIEPEMNNADGFYDDIPKLREKEIRKHNRLRLPKSVRQQLEWQKLQ